MIQRLLEALNPRDFYEKLLGKTLPDENNRGDVVIPCPFHLERVGYEDKTGSCSVSMLPETGGKYQCFGCGAIGNMVTFAEWKLGLKDDMRSLSEAIAKRFNLDPSKLVKEVIDEETIIQWQNALLNTPTGKELVEHLKKKRNLTERVIIDYRLGMNDAGRVTIPIADRSGAIVNVRMWLPEYKRISEWDNNNKIISIRDFGQSRIFPMNNLREQQIVICEGEMDCLALISLGIPALTSTGGAKSFKHQWAYLFDDKDVSLMLDADTVGDQASDALICELYKHTRSIKVIEFDPTFTGLDATAFISKIGPDIAGEFLRNKIANQEPFYMKSNAVEGGVKVNLFAAANADLINKKIEVSGMVVGTEPRPLTFPSKVRITCCSDGKKRCAGCPVVLLEQQSMDVIFDDDDPDILKLAMSKQHGSVYAEKFGLTCKSFRADPLQFKNIEEVQIIPDVDVDSEAYEYLVRPAYYVGYGLKISRTYAFTGVTCVEPNNNYVTHLFNGSQPTDRVFLDATPNTIIDINGREATVDEHLQAFKVGLNQSVHEKLDEIHADLEANVTHIVGRRDVLAAVDLTYHSACQIILGENDFKPKRGWLDTLILGDTQCGKSETAYQVKAHLRAGSLINAETTSRAGITGGYIQIPGQKGVKFVIGEYPRNHEGLVIIDELSGFSEEQIGELTMLRSLGRVVIAKQASKFDIPARVRTIMLSNPRDGMPMNQVQFGCLAIKKLVGGDADVARFDIFLTVSSEEVKLDDIHRGIEFDHPHVYTTDLCSLLIRWVWSRQPSQWRFSPAAWESIKTSAKTMGEQYHPSLPIVVGSSQRWSIARIAAAIAGRLYSTKDGIHVEVEEEHAIEAANFLYDCYNKPSMGYHVYSAQRKQESVINDPNQLAEVLRARPFICYRALIELPRFTKRQLEEFTGMDTYESQNFLNHLIRFNAVRPTSGYLYTTPGFKAFATQFRHPKQDDVPMFDVEIREVEGDVSSSINFN